MAGSAESSRGWSVRDGRDGIGATPQTQVPDQLPATEAAGLTGLQVLRRLSSSPSGLVDADVEQRLVVHGDTLLGQAGRQRWAQAIGATLLDRYTAMIAVLAVVSVVSGSGGTGAVLATLAAVSWALRLVGERRTSVAATTSELVSGTVTVLRRSSVDTCPWARDVVVEDLVPRDIVRLAWSWRWPWERLSG